MIQRLDPKRRFIEPFDRKPGVQTEADRWNELCASPFFHRVLETAWAEFTVKLDAANQMEAMAAHYQLQGGRRFMDILTNLGEQTTTPKSNATIQLTPT